MWRLLFFFSALLIAAAIWARGWYGKRILTAWGNRSCRANSAAWRNAFGDDLGIPEAGATASEYGRALRLTALEGWKKNDPRAARAREAALRFGLGAPPLTVVVVVFAMAAMKLPMFGALAVVAAITALATLFGLLSVGPELRVVAAAVQAMRQRHLFPRAEDEEAVGECAGAEVWLHTLPPILRWIS